MAKLRFEFTIKPSGDGKSNIMAITSIVTESEKMFGVPEDLQPVSLHKLGLMSHLGPATKPFEIISIDTIGGFGGSRSTKKYLFLSADHFTRYAYILTSKTRNANDFIRLINNITETDEIGMLLTDQYPGINSKEFKRFLHEKSISVVFTGLHCGKRTSSLIPRLCQSVPIPMPGL